MQHICEKAEAAGIGIATEFHRGTLCNTAAATSRLLGAVNRPNLQTLWQPPVDLSTPEAAESLREVLPHLAHLHVFQWDGTERRPLTEGEATWQEYLAIAQDQARWALLEFVQGDDPTQLIADARTLQTWTKENS
jgi:sugar phosphate isomerase/epimerase